MQVPQILHGLEGEIPKEVHKEPDCKGCSNIKNDEENQGCGNKLTVVDRAFWVEQSLDPVQDTTDQGVQHCDVADGFCAAFVAEKEPKAQEDDQEPENRTE